MIIDVFFLLCPFSFSQDLVEWSFCGSKSAYALDATLQKFLNNSASEPNKCFPTGDVEVFADNTQLKRKNIRLRKNGTTPIGIASNVVFVQANPDSILHLRDFSPEDWAGKNDNIV